MTAKIKNILIFLGIIILAGVGFYLITQNEHITLDNTGVNTKTAVDTQDFLTKLQDLKEIQLDGSIFIDSQFVTLLDTTKVVVPVRRGRTNPFKGQN